MIHKDYFHGYALALFSIAIEEGKLVKYKKDAIDVIKSIKSNKKYLSLLMLKSLNLQKKEELINEAFIKINNNLKNLLLVLIFRNKIKFINKILTKFISLINNEIKIKEGIVYSVIKLSPKQIEEIEMKISKKIAVKVELRNLIDKSLISGIKVEIGDEIIEDSILSRLEQIKHKLLGGLK